MNKILTPIPTLPLPIPHHESIRIAENRCHKVNNTTIEVHVGRIHSDVLSDVVKMFKELDNITCSSDCSNIMCMFPL